MELFSINQLYFLDKDTKYTVDQSTDKITLLIAHRIARKPNVVIKQAGTEQQLFVDVRRKPTKDLIEKGGWHF